MNDKHTQIAEAHVAQIGKDYRAMHKCVIWQGVSDYEVGKIIVTGNAGTIVKAVDREHFETEIPSFDTKSGKPETFSFQIPQVTRDALSNIQMVTYDPVKALVETMGGDHGVIQETWELVLDQRISESNLTNDEEIDLRNRFEVRLYLDGEHVF